MPMNTVYKALTSDIITRYSFGKSTNYVTMENYNRDYFETFANIMEYIHVMLQIGWLISLMQSLPIAFAVRLVPSIGSVLRLNQVNITIQVLTNEVG